MAIPRDGILYPTLTRNMDYFSCSSQFFLDKLAEVPEYAKIHFLKHDDVTLT